MIRFFCLRSIFPLKSSRFVFKMDANPDGGPASYAEAVGRENPEALGAPERLEAPEASVTVDSVRSEANKLLGDIQSSSIESAAKQTFETSVQALLTELAKLGATATAEALTEMQGELDAIQNDLEAALAPYLESEGPGTDTVLSGAEAGGMNTEYPVNKGDTVGGLLLTHVAGKDAPEHAAVAAHYGIDPALEGQAFVRALFALPQAQKASFYLNLVHPGNVLSVGQDGTLSVDQGDSDSVPGQPEGTTARVASPTEEPPPPEPPTGEPPPAESLRPVSDERVVLTGPAAVVTESAVPEESETPAPPVEKRADLTSAETAAPVERAAKAPEVPGLMQERTRISIAENLERKPGTVEFTYHTEQGNFSFRMANGLIQVTDAKGNTTTYALYRAMDTDSRAGGPTAAPSRAPRFYVATEPKGTQGFFSKDAAEKGTWYHGREDGNSTDYAIGMTPETVFKLAEQIVSGQVSPGHDAEIPTGEKYQDRGRKVRVQPGEDHLTLEHVTDGPAGYTLFTELPQIDGKPPIRVYAPDRHIYSPGVDTSGRGDGYLIQIGTLRVPAKAARETKTGKLILHYQMPGQPSQKLTLEAARETVSTEMKERLTQHDARSNSEAPVVFQDSNGNIVARVVQVGPTRFYQEGANGPWRIVSADGASAILYPEADPLAMNRLENQLTALGVEYGQHDKMPIGVGGVMLRPDAARTTRTEVPYSATLENGRTVSLVVSGSPAQGADLPYALTVTLPDGKTLDPHYSGSLANLNENFAEWTTETAPAVTDGPPATGSEAVDPPPVEAPAPPVEASRELTSEAAQASIDAMEQAIGEKAVALLQTAESSGDLSATLPGLITQLADEMTSYLGSHELPPAFEAHLNAMSQTLKGVASAMEKVIRLEAELTPAQKERLKGYTDQKSAAIEAKTQELILQFLTNPESLDLNAALEAFKRDFSSLFDGLKSDPELGAVATAGDAMVDQCIALGDQWLHYESMKRELKPAA